MILQTLTQSHALLSLSPVVGNVVGAPHVDGAIMRTKKRLLLLHGHRQTGQLLMGRMDKLRKKLAKEHDIELVAIDAPFDGESLKTWWTRDGNDYRGLDTTLKLVQSTWDNDDGGGDGSSFVGIMGFSQGARLVHLLATLHHRDRTRSSRRDDDDDEPCFLRGLQFVIMVSGYDAPLPDSLKRQLMIGPEQQPSPLIDIPSLHVWGTMDKLVSPEQSQAVVAAYRGPEVHVHDGGHHVPMRAESVRTYLSFIGQHYRCSSSSPPPSSFSSSSEHNKEAITIDPDMLQQQKDEIEALQAIYPDEMRIVATTPPLSFEIALPASAVGTWPPHPVSVSVRFPLRYPDVAPVLKLVHDNDGKQFSSTNNELCVTAMYEAAHEEEGMPCIFSCLQAARDFFETGKMLVLMMEDDDDDDKAGLAETASESSLNNNNNNEETDPAVTGGVPLVSEQRKGDCILQGLEIAQSILTAQHPVQSRGGIWSLTIGLVGKPSAGKSTFFNTATGFARQRQQESEIGGAAMAPHPFTTIYPNVGFCLVPAPEGSCPTGDDETMGCTHGRDHLGRRFLPVQLKDVAGLVPGAYQGRGRGNQFLNDLTDADVILHLLDASGTADAEGNKTDAGIHPMDDMEWIRKELIEWVYTNLMRKWDSVVRRGRRKLDGMFSGYGQAQMLTERVLDELDAFFKKTTNEDDKSTDVLNRWDQGDVYRLVSVFLGVRFPIAMALNKIDIPSSGNHIEEIKKCLPMHGALVGTPVSARNEMKFVRSHIQASSRCKNPAKLVPDKNASPPFGTWETLHSTINLLKPLLVFPVSHFETYEPMPSLSLVAIQSPSLPDAGMVNAIIAAGGSPPSSWDPALELYKAKHDRLRDVLVMKHGSTVEDVFLALKRLGALSGEFVRADAAPDVDVPPKPIHKHRVISRESRIVKIMTTKRTKPF